MNVVDSSGWLSYFAGDENASFFSTAIEEVELLTSNEKRPVKTKNKRSKPLRALSVCL